jgi:hypothetical protein
MMLFPAVMMNSPNSKVRLKGNKSIRSLLIILLPAFQKSRLVSKHSEFSVHATACAGLSDPARQIIDPEIQIARFSVVII